MPPAVTPTSASRSARSSRLGPAPLAARPCRGPSCGPPQRAPYELMARDLAGLDLAVLMVDGIIVAGQCCEAALVITVEGGKVPVGLWMGDTENRPW